MLYFVYFYMVFADLLLNKTNFAQEIHGQNLPFKKKNHRIPKFPSVGFKSGIFLITTLISHV